jgi:hypothetical protein
MRPRLAHDAMLIVSRPATVWLLTGAARRMRVLASIACSTVG